MTDVRYLGQPTDVISKLRMAIKTLYNDYNICLVDGGANAAIMKAMKQNIDTDWIWVNCNPWSLHILTFSA